jgi:GcrA cell cycle regulator
MQETWTAEAAETVSALWKSGLTASLIADELGRTRNSVIGKLHRMGLSNSDRPQEIRVRKKPVYRPRPKKPRAAFTPAPEDKSLIANPDRLHPFDAAIPKKQRRQTWELTDKTCRFPVGIPGATSFFHCGASPLSGYKYCVDHVERCYTPVQPVSEAGIT